MQVNRYICVGSGKDTSRGEPLQPFRSRRGVPTDEAVCEVRLGEEQLRRFGISVPSGLHGFRFRKVLMP